MITNLLTKFFGSKNERIIKDIEQIVTQINDLEVQFSPLSDQELQAKTDEFKSRYQQGETLDNLLPEAFATVREAAKRVLGERHYDVQLVGGVVLHRGQVAEMKTGEGKTLTSTLPAYLNGLSSQGVHIVTVNDYLATRDMEWMSQVFNFLGLSTDKIIHDMDDVARKKAYQADITYGTNNEFGFDYLRDNMKFSIEDFCQREPNFAIIDEVDSILIDEARTPLIISGPADISTDLYYSVDKIMTKFSKDDHFTIDEKARQLILTDAGVTLAEKLLNINNLYDPRHMDQLHHVNQALKANFLFKRDDDYIVKNNKVLIVDEFTGRTMEGRRYSDGLHQAIEAKEKVKIERENQTMASITFQNYFRMYKKLAGMTGTADTEAVELKKIYSLNVVVIPTHRTMIRIDYPDVIYKNQEAKYRAIVADIKEKNQQGQPILVGTVSIDISEKIAKMLEKEKIKHHVLNAKFHELEADIITSAGQKGQVTIATNMAGRGTDIKLTAEAKKLGGLYILGTSRHESRRIDNQLRGRSGRQGDLGNSRFFLSLEDDLLRIFGSNKIAGFMDKMGMEEDEPIEHPWISKSIENAQRKVEGHNFDIRKHLLDFDDVMNQQRTIIYQQRRDVLQKTSLKITIKEMYEDVVFDLVDELTNTKVPSEDWNWQTLEERIFNLFHFKFVLEDEQRHYLNPEKFEDLLIAKITTAYEAHEVENGSEGMRYMERIILLQTVDSYWKEHLFSMDQLKQGINLRSYGQEKPLDEYKKEGFTLFSQMIKTVKEQVVGTIFRTKLVGRDEIERMEKELKAKKEAALAQNRSEKANLTGALEEGGQSSENKTIQRDGDKVGRNANCPCGSGKKYKKCCGRLNPTL